MSWITGAGNTKFGKLTGRDTLDLMTDAAERALGDAGLRRSDIDGVLCGYSTIWPHLMMASTFSEHFGIKPSYCHAVQTGGSTGAAMAMLAHRLIQVGQCRNILVVAGENRATGAASQSKMQALADSGHRDFEVPFGPTAPAYFALVASRYMREYGLTRADLAEFPVLARSYAGSNEDSHFTAPLTVNDVLAARVIADPFHLFDCCPMSDGGAALVVSAKPRGSRVQIVGAGQSHPHQNLIGAASLIEVASRDALEPALAEADLDIKDIDICALYDSFSATVLIFLEDLGLAPRGGAADACRRGEFGPNGRLPLNTHGGLLSFGHSGAAGGLMHVIEVFRQLDGRAGARQISGRRTGLVHTEGGTFSTQVSLLLTTGTRS